MAQCLAEMLIDAYDANPTSLAGGSERRRYAANNRMATSRTSAAPRADRSRPAPEGAMTKLSC